VSAPTPIDLRSDTVTRPTTAMRAAMTSAAVGDDAAGLEGNAPPITVRAPLRDLKLAPIQECKASPRRIALGATLGLLAGTAIGVVYGAAGHPGLPHIGADVPSELEYTPLFALGGAVVGGIIGARPPRECPTP
jgi:hypothetical protein